MANGDPKIKYDILADVGGSEEVNVLASALDKLDSAFDPSLPTRATAVASALRALGEKSAAIDTFVRLKQSVGEAKTQMDQAQDAAQKLGREIAATGAPTRAQAGQMEKLRDAVRSSRDAWVAQSAQLMEQRQALRSTGIETDKLVQTQRQLKQEVDTTVAYGRKLVGGYKEQGVAAQASATQQRAAHRQIADGVGEIRDQLGLLKNISIAGIVGGQTVQLLRDVTETADAYENLSARVRLVTGDGLAFEQAMSGIYDIATRTSSSLESTGLLFSRIAAAGKEINLSQADALRLTESINQAVQISGGSAAAADGAITQLIQGLQSGVLRGEEFNSVMEQAPRLAQALAAGLDVTTGKLRQMANEGKLSSEVVIRALQSQSQALQSEFGQLPATVGRAVANLQTEWMKFIGTLNQSSGATSAVAAGINLLAENLDTVASSLVVVGEALVAKKLIDYGAALRASVLAAQETVAANAQAAAATNAHTQATVAMTAATVADTRAKVANAAATAAAGQAAAGVVLDFDQAAKAKGRASLAATALAGTMGLLRAALPIVGVTLLFEGVTRLWGAFRTWHNDIEQGAKARASLAGDLVKFREDMANFRRELELTARDRHFERLQEGAKGAADRVAAARVAVEGLGLDFDQFATGTSRAFAKVFDGFGKLQRALPDLRRDGVDTGRLVQEAFSKLIDAASTEADFKRVTGAINTMGERAGLTRQQLDQLMEATKARSAEVADGVTEAFKRAGIATKAELQKLADEQGQVYRKIRDSGKATAEDLARVYRDWADAATRANNGVTPQVVKQEEALLRVKLAATGAGDALEDGMRRGHRSARDANSEFERTQRLLREIYDQQVRNASLPPSKISGSNESFADDVASGARDRQAQRVKEGRTPTADDNTGLFALLEKQRNGTLSSADLQTAIAVNSAAQANLAMMQANSTAFSLDGQRSAEAAARQARAIVEALGGSAAGQGAGLSVSKRVQVDLNVGGGTSTLYGDEASADALVRALEQGKRARGG